MIDHATTMETSAGDLLRLSMRGTASTVSIVSTSVDGQPFGMMVSAFMSVSLSPPTLAVAINTDASCHAPMRRRRSFCVNILHASQRELGQHFASVPQSERFRPFDWQEFEDERPALRGLPFLREAQSAMFCTIHDEREHGTHSLFLGTVEAVHVQRQPDPLLYGGGKFGRLAPIA